MRDKERISEWLIAIALWAIIILLGMMMFVNVSCKGLQYSKSKEIKISSRMSNLWCIRLKKHSLLKLTSKSISPQKMKFYTELI